MRCHASPRRGLALHPAGQVPGASRQDAAHPRQQVRTASGTGRPCRPPAVESAMGWRAKELPGLRSLPASYISRVEPDCVIEFLLLDPEFPRSVRSCLEASAQALDAIGETGEDNGKAAKALGRMVSDLRYADREHILSAKLHPLLEDLIARC